MIRILLLGPMAPPMGGNTRHFATLISDLESDDRFDVTWYNTSRQLDFYNHVRNVSVALRTVFLLFRDLPRHDVVSFHASNRGMFMFGPLVVMVARLLRRRVILRMFGGSFGDYYEARGRLGRWITRRTTLSADIVLLQTKRSIRQLGTWSTGRLEWFSTYVQAPDDHGEARGAKDVGSDDVCRRMVFLGHVKHSKGIDTLLDAAERMPKDVSIDLYGPLHEYTEQEIGARGGGVVRYRGFLDYAEVSQTLMDYHCLVLPTFYAGEGYPGVIAEAYMHGLPVITTRWLAIPEIVGDDTGILIDPGDTDGLVEAVERIHGDPALWQRLRVGARARSVDFDHATWAERFAELCMELVSGAPRSDTGRGAESPEDAGSRR